MLLIYLIVNYLYRKYGVPLHNFFENWIRGISHLKPLTLKLGELLLTSHLGRLLSFMTPLSSQNSKINFNEYFKLCLYHKQRRRSNQPSTMNK